MAGTFPLTSTAPSYWVSITNGRQGCVFYVDETSRALTLSAAFTGSYYIRDYYGNQVATGTLSAATTVPVPDGLPCGGYAVYLTQTTDDPTFGYAGGKGGFVVVNEDSHFPTFKGVAPQGSNDHGQSGNDDLMHGFTLQGPTRMENSDPTNSAYLSNVERDVTLLNTWYQAVPDSARPRPYIAAFASSSGPIPTGTATTDWESFVDTLVSSYGVQYFEGPWNEPTGINAATVASQMQTFYNNTKAGNADALVIGPCNVTFNYSINQGNGGYFYTSLVDIAAMSPVPLDGISFHGYNCLNGDLYLGQLCYALLVEAISNAGLSGKPLFHSEQGYFCEYYGVFSPRLQGRWTLLMYLLQEQFGIPKEHHCLFFDKDFGPTAFNFPSLYEEGWYFPAVAMIRAFSAEVWGMPPTPTALNFGEPGNRMMLGSVYTSTAGGNQLIALQSAGSTDLVVRFNVSGATTFTLVDCFGNTSTLTALNGILSVPTAMEPVYLRIPAGVTFSLIKDWDTSSLGSDLGLTGTAGASGSSGNVSATASIMVSGPVPSTYYYNNAITSRGQQGAPYVDDTGSFPAWATVTWAEAQTLDTVLVFACPPWQSQGTLLDFEVQYLEGDGETWSTVEHIVENATEGPISNTSANVIDFASPEYYGGCAVETFFSDRWVFLVKFPSKVSTTAIRLYINNATYGGDATLGASNAKTSGNTGKFSNNFTIRQISAYNSVETASPNPTTGWARPGHIMRLGGC